MNIELTDENLVRYFDIEIFYIYEVAKELYLDTPVHALMHVRHMSTLLVKREICRTEALKPSIVNNYDTFNQIKALQKIKDYPNQIIDLLHKIRKSCNHAAHLEKNDLSNAEFSNLARETLKQICDVIALLNSDLSTESTPYVFVENTLPILKDLLYQASIEKNTKAKVKAGKILSECWILEIENNALKNKKLKINNGLQFNDYQRKLAYEFLYSAAFEDNDLEGMFYLAFLIKHRLIHNRDSLDWSELMLETAQLGHEKAKRFWGYQTLVSCNGKYNKETSSDEQVLALSYVKEAASEHRTHQMLLCRLYTDGHLVEKDHKVAEKYLKLAVKNGDRVALYQYANVCFNNGNINKANELIFLSAQSGYKPALSIVMKNNEISYEDRREAFQHYQIIDHRDGEFDMMDHNTDIEITYAELVIEQGDIENFGQASILIHNFLQCYRRSLSDDKFVHYLQLLEKALKNTKITYKEIGNYSAALMMFNTYLAEYEERKKAFLIKKNEKLNQQHTFFKKSLSNTNRVKVGRNQLCPCGSNLKYKKCCE